MLIRQEYPSTTALQSDRRLRMLAYNFRTTNLYLMRLKDVQETNDKSIETVKEAAMKVEGASLPEDYTKVSKETKDIPRKSKDMNFRYRMAVMI